MSRKSAISCLTLSFAALLLLAPVAHADIYKFTDERGITHFHNIPNFGDARYKLFKREGNVNVHLRKGQKVKYNGKFTTPNFNSANRKRFAPIISSAAQLYKVDENLLHAVIMTESAFNPSALSPKGATGLMQLMPGTAKRYGVEDIHDPSDNIGGGTRYLRDLLKMFNNDWKLAVAAYNCGENAVIRYGYKIPPYNETINYVAKVMSSYQHLASNKVKPLTVALSK